MTSSACRPARSATPSPRPGTPPKACTCCPAAHPAGGPRRCWTSTRPPTATTAPRARQVIADVTAAPAQDRNCLVLTNWTGHLEKMASALRELGHDPVILRGGTGAKTRAAAIARLTRQPAGPPLLAAAPGPYAREGFDCPPLATRS